MVPMPLGKSVCIPSHLSEVYPVLSLGQFQCWSNWWWPFHILSRLLSTPPFYASLFQATNCVCPWLCTQSSVSSSSTFKIFWDTSHLEWLPCPPICLSISLDCNMSSIVHWNFTEQQIKTEHLSRVKHLNLIKQWIQDTKWTSAALPISE